MSAKSGLNPDLLAESSESSDHVTSNTDFLQTSQPESARFESRTTSNNSLLQADIDMVAHNIHTYYNKNQSEPSNNANVALAPPPLSIYQPEVTRFESPKKIDGVSPSALRRSLTMHYDEHHCDPSKKASTLPHDFNRFLKSSFFETRKYPLCRYILGVLTHTIAWDRQWGGDETVK